ncbi:MAG: chemotaxis protein CheX [Anaeromyxobacteraceae bacterium]
MSEITRELLENVLTRTLEEAAFVFAEATDAPPQHERTLVEARLAYTGVEAGELTLAAPASLAATIAANLLGEDEGGASTTGDDEDAIGELLNMIAGVVVVELFGEDAACQLGLPRVRRIGPDAHARTLATATAAATMVEEEGRRIDLALTSAGSVR